MAPVSIYKYPNSLATTLEILLLPAPAGPSIAMAIFLVLIITSILHHRVRHAWPPQSLWKRLLVDYSLL